MGEVQDLVTRVTEEFAKNKVGGPFPPSIEEPDSSNRCRLVRYSLLARDSSLEHLNLTLIYDPTDHDDTITVRLEFIQGRIDFREDQTGRTITNNSPAYYYLQLLRPICDASGYANMFIEKVEVLPLAIEGVCVTYKVEPVNNDSDEDGYDTCTF